MVSDQQLLPNFGLMVILALEVLSAPSLRVEIEPRVDSGMPYATLEETCLVSATGMHTHVQEEEQLAAGVGQGGGSCSDFVPEPD
jgi:hypothetical protein